MQNSQNRYTRPRRRKKKNNLIYLLLLAFFALITVTAIVVVNIGREIFADLFPGSETTAISNPAAGSDNVQIPSGDKANQPLQGSDGLLPSDWNGSSRVTALLMGLDYRDWEAGNGASRTDSMMLVTYDPKTNSAGMISIPRDLWVAIPGNGEAKINTAYFLGESYNWPGGGPGLAVQTVEQFFDIHIDFYAQIDFHAFEKFIDQLGGLDIKIREEITIDPLGPGNTKTLEVGTQTLTGAETLAYARQRSTGNGDIDRSQRQQEVLMAIRKQVLTLDMLPGLIAKSPQIYSDLASGLRTNMTLSQVVKIALAATKVPMENIHQVVIGTDDTELTVSYDGQSILLPYTDRIMQKRDLIFDERSNVNSGNVVQVVEGNPGTVVTENNSSPAAIGPATPAAGDLGQAMAAEKAKIVVLNGTLTEGLAGRFEEYLIGSGFSVVGTGNADREYTGITIIDHTGKPSTVQFLSKMLNVPPTGIFNQDSQESNCDITIIIGINWENSVSLP